MTKYLVSFPGPAMDIRDEDMAAVGEAASKLYSGINTGMTLFPWRR